MKNEILSELSKRKGEYLSSKVLSENYNVTRTTIWKYVNELKKDGYLIEASSRKGYKLLKYQDRINIYEIKDGMENKIIGKEIVYLDEVSSTSRAAKKLAYELCEEGVVVIANAQTAGRGRLGRRWNSKPDKGIWMSVILRPPMQPQEVQIITLAASVAIVRTIQACTGIQAGIKWPNDIMVNNKKICGILTELSAEIERVNFIVLGIGLNVKHEDKDFPEELKNIGVSLESILMENGHYKILNRNVIIKRLLIELEKEYLRLLNGDLDDIINEYKSYSILIKNDIKIFGRSTEYFGKAMDVSKEGRLIVKLPDGTIQELLSGEVSIRQKCIN